MLISINISDNNSILNSYFTLRKWVRFCFVGILFNVILSKYSFRFHMILTVYAHNMESQSVSYHINAFHLIMVRFPSFFFQKTNIISARLRTFLVDTSEVRSFQSYTQMNIGWNITLRPFPTIPGSKLAFWTSRYPHGAH